MIVTLGCPSCGYGMEQVDKRIRCNVVACELYGKWFKVSQVQLAPADPPEGEAELILCTCRNPTNGDMVGYGWKKPG